MRRVNINRREFLAHSALIALARTIPAFLSHTVRANETFANGRILVVIQLSGGNDGLNTVVPYADEGYAKHRDKLRLATNELIRINDQVGLHPSLRRAASLLEDGRLAIVQGVGYPNPDRSHDVSMAIWHTARFDPTEHTSFGWIGRAMDERPQADGLPPMMLLGNESPPVAIHGRRSSSIALANLRDLQLNENASRVSVPVPNANANIERSAADDLRAFVQRSALDAYVTADLLERVSKQDGSLGPRYPSTHLADRLRMIATLIKAEFGTSVYYAVQDGYDTHAAQLPRHEDLLRELAGAMGAFLDDLKDSRVDDRVVVLCFSEFGRRVAENASSGTDHGTAGPVFVAGPKVRSGLIGTAPSLGDLDDGDLKMRIDFRQVYASILDDWLGVPSEPVLGGSFQSVGIVNKA